MKTIGEKLIFIIGLITVPLLDEPESNLDFRNQLIILKTIRRLADKGLICIFNTHYPAHSFSIADKCILLGKDKTSIFSNIKDILNNVYLNSLRLLPGRFL